MLIFFLIQYLLHEKNIFAIFCIFYIIACNKEEKLSKISSEIQQNKVVNGSDPDSLWIAQNSWHLNTTVSLVGRPEIADNKITVSEANTLHQIFRFSSASEMVSYIRQLNTHINNYTISHGGGGTTTSTREWNKKENLGTVTPYVTPCTDGAIADFIMNVHECAALVFVPVAGEVLMAGCEIGAIVKFKSALDTCKAA